MNRYHIDMPQPPHDWADPPPSNDWEDDDDGSMQVSAMAIIALISLVFGLAMGWLIWS